MGWFSKIFSSTVKDPIDAIGNIIDQVHTSTEEKQQAKAVLEKIRQHPQLVQAEISKIQAQHRHWFVAGARPSILWVCSLALFYGFIIEPVLAFISTGARVEMPLDYIMELVVALLGLSGLRTVEKAKGLTK